MSFDSGALVLGQKIGVTEMMSKNVNKQKRLKDRTRSSFQSPFHYSSLGVKGDENLEGLSWFLGGRLDVEYC